MARLFLSLLHTAWYRNEMLMSINRRKPLQLTNITSKSFSLSLTTDMRTHTYIEFSLLYGPRHSVWWGNGNEWGGAKFGPQTPRISIRWIPIYCYMCMNKKWPGVPLFRKEKVKDKRWQTYDWVLVHMVQQEWFRFTFFLPKKNLMKWMLIHQNLGQCYGDTTCGYSLFFTSDKESGKQKLRLWKYWQLQYPAHAHDSIIIVP